HLVLRARGEKVALGTEGDAVDLVGMALERVQRLAGGEVPDLDGVVETGRRQQLAVVAEGQAVDQAGVALELARRLGKDRDAQGEQRHCREELLHRDSPSGLSVRESGSARSASGLFCDREGRAELQRGIWA